MIQKTQENPDSYRGLVKIKLYSSKKLPRILEYYFELQSEFISCLFYHSFVVKFELSKVFDQ
ncbi:MAG: hypothetical protein PF486_03865 [Prolixibacteraceae bacterium]|jgi:hypothetical protein|nr:hypothetical protein [Prolixibacteraceae bacterium]